LNEVNEKFRARVNELQDLVEKAVEKTEKP
jgi:hypothetical protein